SRRAPRSTPGAPPPFHRGSPFWPRPPRPGRAHGHRTALLARRDSSGTTLQDDADPRRDQVLGLRQVVTQRRGREQVDREEAEHAREQQTTRDGTAPAPYHDNQRAGDGGQPRRDAEVGRPRRGRRAARP